MRKVVSSTVLAALVSLLPTGARGAARKQSRRNNGGTQTKTIERKENSDSDVRALLSNFREAPITVERKTGSDANPSTRVSQSTAKTLSITNQIKGGRVVDVDMRAKLGHWVQKGDTLCTVEGLKVPVTILAPKDGYITYIVDKDARVGLDGLLVTIDDQKPQTISVKSR